MKKMLLFVAAMFTAATSFAQSGIEVAEPAWTKTITDAVDEASDVNVYAPVVITDQGQIIKTGTFTQAFSFARKSLEPIAKSAYIVKYDKDGYELWGNALQGAATITAITADVAGNIYVAGVFADKVIITSTDGQTVEINGVEDVLEQEASFLIVYDKDGKLLANREFVPSKNLTLFMETLDLGAYYECEASFIINKIALGKDKIYLTASYKGLNDIDGAALNGKVLNYFDNMYIDLKGFAALQLDKDLTNAKILANVYTSESALYGDLQIVPESMKLAVDGDNVFVAWTGWGDLTMSINDNTQDFSFEQKLEVINDEPTNSREHGFVVANITTGKTEVFHAPVEASLGPFFTIADMQVDNSKLYISGTYIGALPFDNTKTSTSSCDAFVAVLNTSDLSLDGAETSGMDENAEGGNKNNEKVTAMIVDGDDINLLIDVVEETTRTTTVVGTYGFVYYSADDARNIRALPVSYHVSAVSVGTAGTAVNADEGTESKVMFFSDDFFTLGINNLEADDLKNLGTQKVYDLSGRRVAADGLQKGIYITNGKKVVISR